MTRALPEWVGKTPDTPVPPRVKIRIFAKYDGVCYLSGRKIGPADQWDAEHIIAIINGGENRERNLAPALVEPHREKTARDVAEKSKVARIRARHLGLKKPSSFPKPPPGYNAWTRRIET
jgi:5-methylcytosine-specific restriction protein A